MRWDLVDKFYILKKGEFAKARKSFMGDEDFFKEHYPNNPSIPEPFFVEMVAQAGGVLFGLGIDFKKEVILAKVLKASFLEIVKPPCECFVEAKMDEMREEGALILGEVRCRDRLVASATILLVAVDSLAIGKSKIVFTEDLLKHYDIFEIAKKSETKA